MGSGKNNSLLFPVFLLHFPFLANSAKDRERIIHAHRLPNSTAVLESLQILHHVPRGHIHALDRWMIDR